MVTGNIKTLPASSLSSGRRKTQVAVARLLFAGVVLLMLLLPKVGQSSQNQDTNSIRFVPSKLFRGELARLEPHLDIAASGCVKVEFHGEKSAVMELEVWENGKRVDSRRSHGSRTSADEVSITVRKLTDGNKNRILRVRYGGLYGWITSDIDAPAGSNSEESFTRSILKPTVEKEGTTVGVWAHGRGKGYDRAAMARIEDIPQVVEWAILLKITIDKTE